ncbi:MAG: TlpA family protein disulfide reductase [Oscillospiraceae bacterium]|nr:TlpA family protein disulfide reductase [Oscillospiraceae bacterium]
MGAAAVLYGRLGGESDGSLGSNTPAPQPEDTPQQQQQQQEEPDYTAPDFAVEDMAGNTVRLSDFLGQPVVLNFWASWCGPCKMEMPAFQTLYDEYGDSVAFLMVNLTDGGQETRDTAKAFVAQSGYTFPVYLDTAYEAAIAYGVSAIPVTYFISADGQLMAYGQSALSEATLLEGLSYILPQG